ncbi:MAG: nucleotidyltransferase domain-containing protein [Kineosporiaceae bacterium]
MTSPATPAEVLQRRRAEREALLDRARRFAVDAGARIDVHAIVVFGSVARGDFHEVSDVDVLVVAERLPVRPVERLAAFGVPPSRVEIVAWTPDEWRRARRRGDPVALECERVGVWLRGTPADLEPGTE